ncbi:hypothetical protein A3K69_00520 [Candidatus Bathyarchaeota archaeon RBG_16_57_9]|nr:MAG: hypothetical protein A3K69_00520 [Candidatus Bathyarchaeota archaeon RBG_16_57_9]
MDETELLSAEARILEAQEVFSEARILRSRISLLEQLQGDFEVKGKAEKVQRIEAELEWCKSRLSHIERGSVAYPAHRSVWVPRAVNHS